MTTNRKVDIAHESLITGWPTLQQWLIERREAEQTRRRLEDKSREWIHMGRGSGGLLDEMELREAEQWLDGVDAADLGYDIALLELVRMSRVAIDQAVEQRTQQASQARVIEELRKVHQFSQSLSSLLLHLTREIGTTLDLDELLTHFLDRLADAVGAIRASIVLTSDEQPRLYSSIRNRPSVVAADILRDGIAGWVLRERQSTIIAETRDDARWVATTPHQQMVRSAASVPILREERVLGVITLVHHNPDYFTNEHLDLLSSVASLIAQVIENAELFRLTRSQNALLERRAEELQRLNQVSRLLTELMRPEQLLRLVTYLVHLTFGYQSVMILLRDDNELVVER